MKILVPTDFSRPSRQAALYAAKLAQALGAEIRLLHVIDLRTPHMISLSLAIEERISQARQAEAAEDCKKLMDQISQKVPGLSISFAITEGNPLEEVVENDALRNDIDLIVIGTHGSSGLEKAVFGSNTVLMMHRSSFPLITVPEYCRFHEIHNIVCASNMSTLHRELRRLAPIAKQLGAVVHVFHVACGDAREDAQHLSEQSALVEEHGLDEAHLLFHMSQEGDVVEAIQEFVNDVEADLLVLYPHEGGFFEDLFRSHVTDEIAFRSLVPLLTFRLPT